MLVNHFPCHAAVDRQAFPGDERILGIRQEQARSGNIVRCPDAAAPMLFVVDFAQLRGIARMDPAGGDGIDAYASWVKARCERMAERKNAAF